MNAIWVSIGVITALGLALLYYLRRPGFRGAIGCRNDHNVEVDGVRISGFSRTVQCYSLKPGEHSFSYLGRQDVPDSVSISWRFPPGSEEHQVSLSVRDVPRDAPGAAALFFVLGKDGAWRAEYSPRLNLESLR
jgi:hypothetical protein